MFLFADIVFRNLPAPLAIPAFSTSALERNATSNDSHTLRTLPDAPSRPLLCARLRN